MRKSTLAMLIILVIIILGIGAYAVSHKSNKSQANINGNSTSQSVASSSNAASGAISIKDMMFTPSQITVAKGGTVTWTNNDSVAHTVVDDLNNVGGPSSGEIAPGANYSFTFNNTGSFQYHCSIHPSMRGTIVVR